MKYLLWILGGLTLLAVAALVVAYFFLGTLITKGVNTFGPQLTGTKVELAGASLSPFTGSGHLTGLFVGNPAGWKSDRAFFLREIKVKVVPTSLLGDHVQVEEVVIDSPEFVYETRLISSNLKELLNNVNKAVGASAQTGNNTSPAPSATGGKPLKFAVKSFRLINAKATVGVGEAAITVPLPDLTFTEIGTAEGGITADQVVGKVLPQVLANIFTEAARSLTQTGGKGGKALGEEAKDAARKVGDGLKSLFGGDKK